MIYLQLFWEFFQTGLFAVGGGLATLPFLTDISARHPEWYDLPMLSNMVAVSNATPGPIGINMATYVGFHVAGIPGALLATFSLVLPSVIIIMIVARMLEKFKESHLVQGAFTGLRPAVTALIAMAGYELVKLSLIDIPAFQQSGSLMQLFHIKGILLFAVLYVFYKKTKLPVIVYIAVGALAGILLGLA